MAHRVLVLGDLHGGYRALQQVLERAGFDPATDTLIFLGDVCDGWPEVKESIALLMELNALRVWGNHDMWAWSWMLEARVDVRTQIAWHSQGGRATVLSFGGDPDEAKARAAPYFQGLRNYILDEERGHVYVHGGLPLAGAETRLGRPMAPLDQLAREYLAWDRDLCRAAVAVWKGDPVYDRILEQNHGRLTPYRKVFIGHTSITRHSEQPIEAGGVVCMDTGAAWDGRLSLMDVDTGQVWQSDRVGTLYEEAAGRQ